MQVKQDKVPVIDANGKQVISANGQPETRIQVTRQNVTTYKYNGFGKLCPPLSRFERHRGDRVTFIFVIIAVPARSSSGSSWRCCSTAACRCAGCGAPS